MERTAVHKKIGHFIASSIQFPMLRAFRWILDSSFRLPKTVLNTFCRPSLSNESLTNFLSILSRMCILRTRWIACGSSNRNSLAKLISPSVLNVSKALNFAQWVLRRLANQLQFSNSLVMWITDEPIQPRCFPGCMFTNIFFLKEEGS